MTTNRKIDPHQTSLDAHFAATTPSEKLRASQARVLNMFRLYGDMHDKQLVAVLNDAERQAGLKPMSPSGARSRRNELVDLKKLRDTGRRELVDGRNVIVWGITR